MLTGPAQSIQRAELSAVVLAVSWAGEAERLLILSDSEWVVSGANAIMDYHGFDSRWEHQDLWEMLAAELLRRKDTGGQIDI